jgi:hypothetical protein
MHPPCARIIYRNLPYLAILDNAGNVRRAHGPFTVGTEPHLAECTAGNEVRDRQLLATLDTLTGRSPALPDNKDTLAAG